MIELNICTACHGTCSSQIWEWIAGTEYMICEECYNEYNKRRLKMEKRFLKKQGKKYV